MVKARVKIVDRGWNKIRDEIAKARRESHVKVGVFSGDAKGGQDRDGITNVELAAVHEFGGGNVPARPWIRGGVDARRTQIMEHTRKLVKGLYEGRFTVEQALNMLGLFAATQIKDYVRTTNIPPPLSDALFQRKAAKGTASGPVRTLIDTGRMLGSVTWQAVAGGITRQYGARK
jgi:hypothetical protein